MQPPKDLEVHIYKAGILRKFYENKRRPMDGDANMDIFFFIYRLYFVTFYDHSWVEAKEKYLNQYWYIIPCSIQLNIKIVETILLWTDTMWQTERHHMGNIIRCHFSWVTQLGITKGSDFTPSTLQHT